MPDIPGSDKRHIEYLSPAKAVAMADEWYDCSDLEHFWIQWRFQYVMKYKQYLPPANEAVLEIGCGHGLVREQLETYLNYTVDACDLNETGVMKAKPGKGRLFVYDVYDRHPGLYRKYSAIYLMDVIEHIESATSFLDACFYHLKPGGAVLINVPAMNLLFSRYDILQGHVCRYNKRMMRQLMERVGLEIMDMTYWGFPMVPILFLRKYYLNFVSDRVIIETGFKPPNPVIHRIFHMLRRLEIWNPITPPLGTSLMAVGRLRQ